MYIACEAVAGPWIRKMLLDMVELPRKEAVEERKTTGATRQSAWQCGGASQQGPVRRCKGTTARTS